MGWPALLVALAGCPTPPAQPTCASDADCTDAERCSLGQCVGCAACGADEACVRGRCLERACTDHPCAQGQGCQDGTCRDRDCVDVACAEGEACARGTCYPADCSALKCGGGEVCAQSQCEPVGCVGVTCPTGEACGADGRCAADTCAGVVCASGAACAEGRCVDRTCIGLVCPSGTFCADGHCLSQACNGVLCPENEVCEDGNCVDPRCQGMTCPAGSRCHAAACEACAATEHACADGLDDDCDGLSDCADPDCSGAACDDGDACTTGETCEASRCGGGSRVDCAAGAATCQVVLGACDAVQGCRYGAAPEGAACPDDGEECTLDACSATGECLHPARVYGTPCAAGVCAAGACQAGCFVESALVTPGFARPGDSCRVCDPVRAPTEWTVLGPGESCGAELICDEVAACRSGCLIAGEGFVAAGTVDPANTCTACTPADSTSTWTQRRNGADCGAAEVCDSGSCTFACFIAGAVVPAGARNPAQLCEVCSPLASTTEWATRPDGDPCDTGKVCRMDSCKAGCFIGGAFIGTGALDGVNACQACLPGLSTTEWSPVAAGTPCGTGNFCDAKACKAGCFIDGQFRDPGATDPKEPVCAHCDPATYATWWTPAADGTPCGSASDFCGGGTCTSGCFIGGSVYPAGAAAYGSGGCKYCDVASSTAWLLRSPGSACDDGNVCTAPDQCTAAGTCLATPLADGTACPDGSGNTCWASDCLAPISSCIELQQMKANLVGGYFLAADVDCAATAGWNPDGSGGYNGFAPVGQATGWNQFSGTFDGRGHAISNLYVRWPDRPAALFGALEAATVRNLVLASPQVATEGALNQAGAVAAYERDSTFFRVAVHGGAVTSGGGAVGCILGEADRGSLDQVWSDCSVSTSGTGANAGGLAGKMTQAPMRDSFFSGQVAASGSGSATMGPLAGYDVGASAHVDNCYAVGAPQGAGTKGCLAGYWNGSVGTVNGAYYDSDRCTDSSIGAGKGTASMKQEATFASWDFAGVWRITEGVTYPCLQWDPAACPQ